MAESLHQAVARAIADANCGGARSAYCYEDLEDCECRKAAAVAIHVVREQVEAIPPTGEGHLHRGRVLRLLAEDGALDA